MDLLLYDITSFGMPLGLLIHQFIVSTGAKIRWPLTFATFPIRIQALPTHTHWLILLARLHINKEYLSEGWTQSIKLNYKNL